MGKAPSDLVKTFLAVNIPATIFNVFVAPAPVWQEENTKLKILTAGVVL